MERIKINQYDAPDLAPYRVSADRLESGTRGNY
jgi:hypothetical protein